MQNYQRIYKGCMFAAVIRQHYFVCKCFGELLLCTNIKVTSTTSNTIASNTSTITSNTNTYISNTNTITSNTNTNTLNATTLFANVLASFWVHQHPSHINCIKYKYIKYKYNYIRYEYKYIECNYFVCKCFGKFLSAPASKSQKLHQLQIHQIPIKLYKIRTQIHQIQTFSLQMFWQACECTSINVTSTPSLPNFRGICHRIFFYSNVFWHFHIVLTQMFTTNNFVTQLFRQRF